MRASPFDHYLMNLREMLPASSLSYMSREEAHEKLKELSGQDFGYDDDEWLRWAVENEKTLCFRPN